MTENSALENDNVEDQKNVHNGDVHTPETQPLENGDVKTVTVVEEEQSTSTVQVIHSTETDVAEKQKTETNVAADVDISVKADAQLGDGKVKDEIQITHTFLSKENRTEIIEEDEECSNEITRNFEFVHFNEKISQLNGSKDDEIITLQEVVISPTKQEQNAAPKEPERSPRLVSWDTKKTVFFYFFLIAFVVWIIAYYAFDTGLIPNDKKK